MKNLQDLVMSCGFFSVNNEPTYVFNFWPTEMSSSNSTSTHADQLADFGYLQFLTRHCTGCITRPTEKKRKTEIGESYRII